MKKSLLIVMFLNVLTLSAQDLRSVLLKQLKTTHNEKDWFVPANIAVAGMTAEQASWKEGTGNHSVGQLLNHLIFWNERELNKFLGKKNAEFDGNNEETFGNVDQNTWNNRVNKLDAVLLGWENAIVAADESKLKDSYSTIANISTHNAYHTGQIIVVRKLQGSWNPEQGVK